jgi:hypothetical protein
MRAHARAQFKLAQISAGIQARTKTRKLIFLFIFLKILPQSRTWHMACIP